jgi:hypothetical protein
MTDAQIDQVGRRFAAAMTELMAFIGDSVPGAAETREPAVAVG